MFHRFTSFFYADSKDVCTLAPDPKLTEKEDDGWLIVDFPVVNPDACITPSSEEVKANSTVPDDTPPPLAPSSLESLSRGSDSSPARSSAGTLEESWFVTPPPCFTAEGQDDIQVESSPLENLLIEHPSMSVYADSNINTSTLEEVSEINIGGCPQVLPHGHNLRTLTCTPLERGRKPEPQRKATQSQLPYRHSGNSIPLCYRA
ncbi:tumor protein p53-inducible nuclear protein 1 isoform X3 [Hypanus sabinus]|uniref:tumor protein p53-inducible nuclear protein 1 isoform X3 n=1 Tax=Hypanus sabinus TaxID=79690 RepID=UPI0028C4635C|nr:tumor protein p53-inducible nuclear protein 1 isoform X3 [Hypanus sabinus]